MNWKKFKNLVCDGASVDEAHFVLGIDIGNDCSSLSSFNVQTGQAEVVDISGGYGKPSVPTAMQYVVETKEWVYGEYAVLGDGSAGNVLVTGLVERLGKRDYVDVDGRSVSVVTLLSMFIRSLVSFIYNINPRAEIVGVVAAVPSYLSDDARGELLQALVKAGLEKELIGLVSDRECVLHGYFSGEHNRGGRLMLLDLGARELRGTVFDVVSHEADSVRLRSTSSLFENSVSTGVVGSLVSELFTMFYCDNFSLTPDKITPAARASLAVFSYQNRDILFQKGIRSRPARLYFNFAYPAFSRNVTEDEVAEEMGDIHLRMRDFITKLLSNNAGDSAALKPSDIGTVLAYGGGFEMVWARELLLDIFGESGTDIRFHRNSKARLSEGAAVAAARALSLLPELTLSIQDLNRVNVDIGLMITSGRRERFMPLVEQSSFWWQKRPPVHFILGDAVEQTPPGLCLYRRDQGGEIVTLDEISLTGLPDRPRGATRLSVDISFRSFNFVTCRVKDLGFGDIFPKSDVSVEKSFFI